jgi:hypothetical protein
MSNTVPVLAQSHPIVVVNTTQERRPPRIAKGIFVLLVSGIFGMIVFAMGQSVWGAIWRGWLVSAILLGIVLVVL